jgi:histidinol phosphatase-like enzyme (inositol monophosphatase family)
MNVDELNETLSFAVEAAREAGNITLEHFRNLNYVDRKADGSLVTIADREAENFLRESIETKFPNDAIIGEEFGEKVGTSNRRWIVDPIDGTYSFVHGVPFYGVLIGVEIENEPCVGVINIPALNEIVYAAKGLGCCFNDVPTKVSDVSSLDEALLLVTDFDLCEKYGFGNVVNELKKRVDKTRTWGDCYGHVLVATGRAEIMLDPVMNVWDCAALLPVIEEAGGAFTDWKGQRTINGGNAIATNGKLFDDVIERVKQKT